MHANVARILEAIEPAVDIANRELHDSRCRCTDCRIARRLRQTLTKLTGMLSTGLAGWPTVTIADIPPQHRNREPRPRRLAAA